VNTPRGGKGLSDTSTRGSTQTSLDVADLPADTLYITFRDGQVVADKPVTRRRLAQDELAALPAPQPV
jgi:hypothetical protein